MTAKKLSWGLAVAVIFFDLAAKELVRRKIFLKFPVIENSGLIFGINLPGFFNLIIVIGALLVFVFFYWRREPSSGGRVGFALIVGGALANLAERVGRGAVTDFLNLGISTVNFADAAIFVGVILALFF